MKIKCPHCHTEYDVALDLCPHCGKPAMGPREKYFWYGIVVIVPILLIFGFFSCVSSCKSSNEAYQKEKETEGSLYQAKILCEQRIKNMLKAPSTAKITFENKNKIGTTYTFSGYVDAQNSFGAMLRKPFYIRLEFEPGKGYKILKFDFE